MWVDCDYFKIRREPLESLVTDLKIAYGLDVIKAKKIIYGLNEECFEIDMKDKKFFAKRFYKKSRLVNRYDEMKHGLRLSDELRKKGFPSPKIILSLKGEYLAVVGENTYQVNEWIDGLTYHPSQMPPSAARSMGEVLATFHSWTNSEYETRTLELMSPNLILKETVDLLEQYKEFSGEFPDFAKKSLTKEIKILNSIII